MRFSTAVTRLALLLAVVSFLVPAEAWAQRAAAVPAFDGPSTMPVAPAPRGGEVLYDQTGNPDDQFFPSQTFEANLAIYNSQGADDFVVPAAQTWTLTQVEALGAYGEGQGPASIVDVYFYADAAGQPGDVFEAYLDVSIEDPDTTGVLLVELPSALELTEGVYWVSVVADMDRFPDGQWYWNKQATAEPLGAELHWRNPGDGFETGCTSWGLLVTECGDEGGLDASFRLSGSFTVSNEDEGTPTAFVVSRNYPNPFARETAVEIGLPVSAPVSVVVYDVLGRRVETLLDEVRPAGYHRVTWQAGGVPNGLYFCRIESAGQSHTLRMTVAR